MEIILAILVSLVCAGSFISGLYIGKTLSAGKEPSVKQLKRDLGFKPKAEIFSPLKREKSREILRDLPEEHEL